MLSFNISFSEYCQSFRKVAFIFVLICMTTSFVQAQISKDKLPFIKHIYAADPSARVFNGRLYVYTSHDEDTATYYNMKDWHVFSTDNLVDWKDHGAIFSLNKTTWANKWAWAPDCVQQNGKYYFYFPVERSKIGVAVSSTPIGPFKDALNKPLIDNTGQDAKIGSEPIDPAVFVDDDGSAYMYFGCRQLRMVKLKKDMVNIEGDVQTIQIKGNEGDKEGEGGFFAEAPWMFKRNGVYYFVYSNGWSNHSTLVYATGKSPTGPFQFQGEIMPNANCLTSHGSIVQFKGKWYVFYHNKSLSGNNLRRSPCFDEITFTTGGRINRLQQKNISEQTTFINPLNFPYRFSLDTPSRREAADPSIIQYKGEYYMFVSRSGGYFSSTDLLNWKLIKTTDLPLENYAPTAMVMNDTIYFMASGEAPVKIFKTADPKSGKWQVANGDFPITMIDPNLFLDDDGRVFFYYGASNINPIYGVELDMRTLNPIGNIVSLFNTKREIYGWERQGNYNEKNTSPWIEGAWMTKHNGKYYLQYAAPGTEFKSYSDGVYISDNPLGPFALAKHNPLSYKPEGFATGAGHGSTFSDRYGNYWHMATMTISQKHMFERRLGMFPAFFNKDGEMHVYTGFGDFPILVPQKKIEQPEELFSGWMLLSYKKPVEVSSTLPGHSKHYATDEEMRTYWSAETGKKGEWISMDLQKICIVNAIQVNYGEHNTKLLGSNENVSHQYFLEYSTNKKNWYTLVDKTKNGFDVPHDYVALSKPVKARYIRLTNYKVPDGTFAISGLRIFGNDGQKVPSPVNNLIINRQTDRAVVKLKWVKSPAAIGYNIRFGTSKDKLYHTYQVLDAEAVSINSLNTLQPYYFSIDAFNESGVTMGRRVWQIN